jgi:hypothetical protein
MATELRFGLDEGYSAAKKFENDQLYVALGTTNQPACDPAKCKLVAIVHLKELDLCVIGDQKLYDLVCQCPNFAISRDAVFAYVIKYISPEKFAEIIIQVAMDRYNSGYKTGQLDLQNKLQHLLGIA